MGKEAQEKRETLEKEEVILSLPYLCGPKETRKLFSQLRKLNAQKFTISMWWVDVRGMPMPFPAIYDGFNRKRILLCGTYQPGKKLFYIFFVPPHLPLSEKSFPFPVFPVKLYLLQRRGWEVEEAENGWVVKMVEKEQFIPFICDEEEWKKYHLFLAKKSHLYNSYYWWLTEEKSPLSLHKLAKAFTQGNILSVRKVEQEGKTMYSFGISPLAPSEFSPEYIKEHQPRIYILPPEYKVRPFTASLEIIKTSPLEKKTE